MLDVSATSASVQATIDPQGSETTYRFEYGTSEAYGSSAPVPDGIVGSGSAPVTVNAHIQGLTAGAAYHFRVVAIVQSSSETVDGADMTFSTQSTGVAFALPDGRQWELVSPPNKHGAPIQWMGSQTVMRASENGGAMTYAASAPTESEPAGFANSVQIFSQRGPQGWSSKDISTPHNSLAGVGLNEYAIFSEDLSSAVLQPEGSVTPLSPAETERSPNIRHNFLCESAPSACYTPLVTSENIPAGVKFDNFPEGQLSVQFAGTTPDLSHVILGDGFGGLTETPGDNGGLYEWSAGRLQLVNILPAAEGGGPAGPNSILGSEGTVGKRIEGAISHDGSRVFWSNPSGQELYVRDTVDQETLRIGGNEAAFEAASEDGSRVFYGTDVESGALEVCDIVRVAGKMVCDTTQIAPNVLSSVSGISSDGSWVYFVSNAVLASGAAPGECRGQQQGQIPGATCSLYARHYNGSTWESPKLIATLSSDDFPDWHNFYSGRTTGLSSDGRWFTFMSQRSLTGYDNRDAASAQPDEEVYLYDSQTEKLSCVSCDPTGARPAGSETRNVAGEPVLSFSVWPDAQWLASDIPGWTPTIGGAYNSSFQSRFLSADGRLFFNSRDSLAPQDVNGEWDVYEYEPGGVGDCNSSSLAFSTRQGGCVSLVSSGTSPSESGFMDASATGNDVFFVSASKLAPEDFDSAMDVYDAHVCSAAVPCSTSPVSPPPCSTGDACKVAPTPQPANFGAPASQTFSGVGNLPAPTSRAAPAPRSLTRAQLLSRALRTCRHRSQGAKRRKCERTARHRFAAKKSRAVAMSRGRGNS